MHNKMQKWMQFNITAFHGTTFLNNSFSATLFQSYDMIWNVSNLSRSAMELLSIMEML